MAEAMQGFPRTGSQSDPRAGRSLGTQRYVLAKEPFMVFANRPETAWAIAVRGRASEATLAL